MSNYPNDPDRPSNPLDRSFSASKKQQTSINEELEKVKRELAELRSVVKQLVDVVNNLMLIEHPGYGDQIQYD